MVHDASVAAFGDRSRTPLARIKAALDDLPGWLGTLDDGSLGEPLIAEPSELLKLRPAGPLLVAGDGAAHLSLGHDVSLAPGSGRPDARAIAQLAAEGRVILAAVPLYLRAPDVTLPRAGS